LPYPKPPRPAGGHFTPPPAPGMGQRIDPTGRTPANLDRGSEFQ